MAEIAITELSQELRNAIAGLKASDGLDSVGIVT